MSEGKWVLPVGMTVLLILFILTPLFTLLIGWPGQLSPDEAMAKLELSEPIAGPAPAVGLPENQVRAILLSSVFSLGLALGAWLVAPVFKEATSGRRAVARPRAWLVGLLGLASLATYALNFLLPFPLRRYFNLKQISLGLIASRDGDVALATAVATVALFLFYGLAHRLCRGKNDRKLWIVVLLGALILALVNFFVATTTTLDLYDYIARGRITGVHGGNVYTWAPARYATDPFTDYVSWRDVTSAYGPIWETISGLLGRAAGNLLWTQVLAYKGLALGGYLISVVLVAVMLRRKAPDRALSGTLLYAWNPLILMECVANAHNDVLMVVLLLAALWVLAWTGGKPTRRAPAGHQGRAVEKGIVSALLLSGAVLIKFVPGLILPLVFVYVVAGQKGWRRQATVGLVLVVLVAVFVAASYFIFWDWDSATAATDPTEGEAGSDGGILSTFARRFTMFRMSAPSVIKEALQKRFPEETAIRSVAWPFLSLFVLGYGTLLVRTSLSLIRAFHPRFARRLSARQGMLKQVGRFLFGAGPEPTDPWKILVRGSYRILLLYLLLANFWFWPWYLIWPIALLALAGDERTAAPMIVASCAGELAHVAWNFVVYWWGISWDTFFQVDALVVFFLLAVPLSLYLLLGLRRRARAPAEG